MQILRSRKKDIALKGEITVAGDKSISHRSLIFSALAHGESKISGLLEGEDVLKTAAALRLMGVKIEKYNHSADASTRSPLNKEEFYNSHRGADASTRSPLNKEEHEKSYWTINGVGVAGLSEPSDILDMGNSGTSSRLMAGLVCPYNFTTFFTGDASLRKRPMGRVFEPITQIGAKIISRQNNLMPFAVIGARDPMPISYQMRIASAQVKSCILLAALTTRGTTTIIEPEKCRDHTEIMMRYLGLKIVNEKFGENGTKISYSGLQEFNAKNFIVPGDISSAAFLIVAALLVKDSKIKIKNVGINPLRDGIITTLCEMGGQIQIVDEREVSGEKVADLIIEHSKLKGIEIPASRAPSMIDEYPILAIAAANADGITKMSGLAELKVKESNRLLMIAQNLEKCGTRLKMGNDYLEVQGGITQPKNLVKITTSLDHRIAMSFLVMGLTLENGVEIDDASMIKTSFPTFEKIFADFGSAFEAV